MNRGTIILLAVAFIVIAAGWGIRVYQVNVDVAKSYEIQMHKKGERVAFENVALEVKDFHYGEEQKEEGYEFVPVEMEMEIINESEKNLSIIKVIESKLAFGMDYYQTIEGDFDVEKLRNLPPETKTNITLIFNVKPEYKNKKAKLYIDQSLYSSEVKEKYKKGKRLGIAIEL
ncbi:hypothetical protein G3A_02965 [Bacillus sp. 17376]|uniref:DUF4352 domain-containing protein n=1 Tax=Mesobacillus boroniphilus JCM 21738 TaxID=1294265 RepID=W4RVB9_9BACI|nr:MULTISPECIES: hypothetical protein [Bacillaceae]ESU34081.1 hypothetical protein G3A_02965 [Bacillus sp. 17376]MBT2681957.1 hypothetical protein [Bacillus sp. ISL-35]MBT2706320.1 hypothetical protein [Chryseobacterium sp. ISL-80]GAE48047.1 hypothetical protein JCM21738_5122 [Mesobacillus boroniphilus JCM 21738]